MTIADIDTNTILWTDRIKNASEQTIPQTSYRILPHYKTTHQSRLLQIQCDALKTDIEMDGLRNIWQM